MPFYVCVCVWINAHNNDNNSYSLYLVCFVKIFMHINSNIGNRMIIQKAYVWMNLWMHIHKRIYMFIHIMNDNGIIVWNALRHKSVHTTWMGGWVCRYKHEQMLQYWKRYKSKKHFFVKQCTSVELIVWSILACLMPSLACSWIEAFLFFVI